MRTFIIDTDTAGDDAAALILAAHARGIRIAGITATFGNVSLDRVCRNAAAALRVAGVSLPIYAGASVPSVRAPWEQVSVYGTDGLGDCGLSVEDPKIETRSAVDFILDTVRANAGQVEILALGPMTNIAAAWKKDPETMRGVARIWSMGTAGFGPGNVTPVAEFNVFADAEAYAEILASNLPLTVAGFDLCTGETALSESELSELSAHCFAGKFIVDATRKLFEFNASVNGRFQVELADAVAACAAFYPQTVTDSVDCYGACCVAEACSYGQVIFAPKGKTYEAWGTVTDANVTVIRSVDAAAFKRILTDALLACPND